MSVLAPWPRTRMWLGSGGRTSNAETSPFSGVATNFDSATPWATSGPLLPPRSRRLGEAEADAVRLLGEEHAVGPAAVVLLFDDPRLDTPGVQFASQGVHVADREPATRLLRVPPVDRKANPRVVSLEHG